MRERLRQNTPLLCAEPPPQAQVYFLVNRRVSVEGKVRCAQVQNRNDTCVGVQSQLRWVQDRALKVSGALRMLFICYFKGACLAIINEACAQRAYTLILSSTQKQQFSFLQIIHYYDR